jgi:hypothetical protein
MSPSMVGLTQIKAATRRPLGARRGDSSVSFDLPNLVVVLTQVNRRYSVSGSTPILVAR